MSKDIIAKTKCAFCHNPIEIATEDLEWEHMTNCGENDENPELIDFSISQKISCPNCKKDNEVLVTMKGNKDADVDFDTTKIVNFSEIKKLYS